MSAIGFRPSRKYVYKKFLQTSFIGILVLGLSLIIASYVGEWVGGTEGAATGRLVSLTIVLTWLIPALILIYPTHRSHFYEIHADEVVMHSGLIIRKVSHVPIQMITNMEVLRDPFDRVLGLGTINIQTASVTDQGGATECLVGLQNFKAVYDHLTSAIKHTRNPYHPEAEASLSLQIDTLKRLIDELKILRTLLDGPEHQG